MPLPLGGAAKAVSTSLGNGAPSNVGLVSQLLSKRSGQRSPGMMDDDDDFWDEDIEHPPPTKLPKTSNFLKTVMRKNLKKAESVHIAKRQLREALEEESEGDGEEGDLPLTESQEALTENCRSMRQKTTKLVQKGIPAPAWGESVFCEAKGTPFRPTLGEEFEDVAVIVLLDTPACDAVPPPDKIFERALVSGRFQHLYLRGKPATEAMLRPVFECIYRHKDNAVSSAAFRCLASVLGASSFDLGLHRQTTLKRKWASPLHALGPHSSVEWSPSLSDYSAALAACGLPTNVPTARSPAAARRTKGAASKGKEAVAAEEVPNKTMGTDSSLLRLKLLLRLLTVHSSSRECPFHDDIIFLLPTILRLHLDPAVSVYYQDLQAAVPSILAAVSQTAWDNSSHTIAAEIAALGPSHRSAVRILQALPVSSDRGAELQRMSAIVALERVVDARQRGKTKRSARGRGGHSGRELQYVLDLLGDAPALVEAAKSAKSAEEWNFWSIISAVQLVDMLMWMPAKRCAEGTMSQDEEESKAIADWADFLEALRPNVQHSAQDDSQSRAALLVSEVSSFYDFVGRKGFL